MVVLWLDLFLFSFIRKQNMWSYYDWVGDTEQSRLESISRLESTTEITQNKHVKVLHYFVDDIKWLKWYLYVNFIDVLVLTEWIYTRKIGAIYFRFTKIETSNFYTQYFLELNKKMFFFYE